MREEAAMVISISSEISIGAGSNAIPTFGYVGYCLECVVKHRLSVIVSSL